VWRGESWEIFLSSGEIEGSDPQRQSLRKILYQAYHMLKKVKSAQMSACPNLSVGHVFPPTKKHDRSADRQMTDLIFRDTLLSSSKFNRGVRQMFEEMEISVK